MGTNDWVLNSFERLNEEHEVLAVFTTPPRPSGRKMQLTKTPVHIWAEEKGLKVHNDISEYDYDPDFNIVMSYGVILRDNVLSRARTVNVHPSDLPKYRGPSPMLTAIKNGDESTVICLMDVAPELDAGDVLIRYDIEIHNDDTIQDLEDAVSSASADILSAFLKAPYSYEPVSQEGAVTFTKKF